MSERIVELWARLEDWLANKAPNVSKNLKVGASEEALAEAEAHLGRPLGDELRAWFGRHDGELGEVDSLLGDQLQPLEFALGVRDMLMSIKGEYYVCDWSPAWLPITTDHTGNFHYVDLASGQVRDFDHEGWEHAVIADSLTDYLEAIVGAFEQDEPEWDEELGWVTGDEWSPFEDMDFETLEQGDLDPALGQAKQLVEKARQTLSQGDEEGALALFDQAVEAQPQNLETRFARARARFKHGDYAGAREDLTPCLGDESDGPGRAREPEALRVLGQVCLAEGDKPGAQQAFERYLGQVATRTDYFGKIEISGPPGVDLVVRLLQQLGADPTAPKEA